MINQKNLLFILIGIISGFFVGLIGIGSGVIAIPGLTMAGLNIKQAITTGLFLQAVPQIHAYFARRMPRFIGALKSISKNAKTRFLKAYIIRV